VIYRPRLSDDHHLNLAGELYGLIDSLGDIMSGFQAIKSA